MGEAVWVILGLWACVSLAMIATRRQAKPTSESPTVAIQAIQVRPGDHIIVSFPGHLNNDDYERLKADFEQGIGGAKVVILGGGLRLVVVQPSTISTPQPSHQPAQSTT